MIAATHRRLIAASAVAVLVAAVLLCLHSKAMPPDRESFEAVIEPATVAVETPAGGVVEEVFVEPGQLVVKGQPIARFSSGELRARRTDLLAALRAVERAGHTREIFTRIPAQLRTYIYQSHPDLKDTEEKYVQALEMLQHAPADSRGAALDRLNRAAEDRMRVRRELARGLTNSGAALEPVLAALRKNIAEVDRLLERCEVTALSAGIIEILNVQPGTRLRPKSPVAMVQLPGEYFSEIVIDEAEAARLQPGMPGRGALTQSGQPFEWRVEKIEKRRVAFAFRDDWRRPEENILRAAVTSRLAIEPGAAARFVMP